MGQENYLGIDVGGSKTLFAVFDPAGQKVFEHKIKTPQIYSEHIASIAGVLKTELAAYRITSCCCAVPGWIDFNKGIAVGFGNLPWENVPILQDLQSLMPGVKVLVHNDAKLAGLSEAKFLADSYHKVLYLTISTGIGGGLIIDGVIDRAFYNFEPGQMRFEYHGKDQTWETFASGKALFERYGKLASELDDEIAWKDFSQLIALGLEELLATIQPDVVVFGGGVGAHFEKFKDYLEEDLNSIKNPLVPIPPLVKAHRPEEAVIYGCYDYIIQNAS
jgi:predicted NBD/HSP70 family sugar kinase